MKKDNAVFSQPDRNPFSMTSRPRLPLRQGEEAAKAVRARCRARFYTEMPAIGALVALASVMAASRALSGFHFGFDLLASVSHFLVIPFLGVFSASILTQRWFAAGTALGAALLSCSPLTSATAQRIAEPFAGATASVLHCNIGGSQAAWDGVRAIIEAEEPDIVSMVEVSDGVLQRIRIDKQLLQNYPHRVLPERGLEWPSVILSRHPMRPLPPPVVKPGTRMQALFSSHRSNLVSLPVGDIIFTTEHVPSPRSSVSWTMGNEQIVALGHLVRDHYRQFKVPILITGDFNSSPSGYRDGLMRKTTGLLPDPESVLPIGTWPASFPAYVRLPLDRGWASEQVAFARSDVLNDVGSDHRPICLTFAIQ